MKHLDLWDVSLVGFSMGSGEVTRYLGTYGSDRVRRAVLVASVPPFLLQTGDNPEGIPEGVFGGIQRSIVADRPAYLSAFFADFYNVDVLGGTRISGEAVQASFNVAAAASAKGTLDCVPAWLTDFRHDLPRIDVPTLIIHGAADQILPLAATSARLPALVADSRLVVVPDGPHGLIWTHADVVNPVLLEFLE